MYFCSAVFTFVFVPDGRTVDVWFVIVYATPVLAGTLVEEPVSVPDDVDAPLLVGC